MCFESFVSSVHFDGSRRLHRSAILALVCSLASASNPIEPGGDVPVRRGAVLRILHLEDSEDDHALVVLQLHRAGLAARLQRVETLAAFEAALPGDWDAILSDYNLPGFTGLDALACLRLSGHVLPFILVSGQIGEDMAVEAMRNGASDYLLKHNLTRLVPALERAIERAVARRGQRRQKAGRYLDELWVPHRSELLRIAVSEVHQIDAERDYVRLHVGGADHVHVLLRLARTITVAALGSLPASSITVFSRSR